MLQWQGRLKASQQEEKELSVKMVVEQSRATALESQVKDISEKLRDGERQIIGREQEIKQFNQEITNQAGEILHWKEQKERHIVDSGIGKNWFIERLNREVKRRVKWFSTFQSLEGAHAFFGLWFYHHNTQ